MKIVEIRDRFMADAPSNALAWMRQLNGKEGECK